MSSRSVVIETTVGEVAAELARRGLDPHDRVMVTIEPDELVPGRREARLAPVQIRAPAAVGGDVLGGGEGVGFADEAGHALAILELHFAERQR